MEYTKKVFKEYGGIMRTCEIKKEAIYFSKVKELISKGYIRQIRRGYYQFISDNSSSDIPIINKLFPDGILCRESALDYYGYMEKTPSAWHLAVDNRSPRTRFYIDYPVIKPHFITEERYNLGVITGEIDGNKIKVFDRERTICDILLRRNKIDNEIFNTAARRYMKDPKKVESRLISYAEELHIEQKLDDVFEKSVS